MALILHIVTDMGGELVRKMTERGWLVVGGSDVGREDKERGRKVVRLGGRGVGGSLAKMHFRFMCSQKRNCDGLIPNFHIHVSVSDLRVYCIFP